MGSMQTIINNYREKINELKTKRKLIKQQYKEKNTELKEQNNKLKILFEVQEIIKTVAQQTQNNIKIHITDIVNMVLDIIPFPKKPDYFDMEFVIRRDQTECDLFIVENGKRSKILETNGGGVIDIISFGLKIACWSLQIGKKNNTLIFDEPFKNINDPDNQFNLMAYVSEMMKTISEKLKIQMIIVGSNGDFIDIADKLIKVSIDNRCSKVVIREV